MTAVHAVLLAVLLVQLAGAGVVSVVSWVLFGGDGHHRARFRLRTRLGRYHARAEHVWRPRHAAAVTP